MICADPVNCLCQMQISSTITERSSRSAINISDLCIILRLREPVNGRTPPTKHKRSVTSCNNTMHTQVFFRLFSRTRASKYTSLPLCRWPQPSLIPNRTTHRYFRRDVGEWSSEVGKGSCIWSGLAVIRFRNGHATGLVNFYSQNS